MYMYVCDLMIKGELLSLFSLLNCFLTVYFLNCNKMFIFTLFKMIQVNTPCDFLIFRCIKLFLKYAL